MSKLPAVIRHEYMTIVKQPTFWLIMLAIPAIIATIIGISYFTNKVSEERISEAASQIDNIAVIDESGLIRSETLQVASVQLSPPEQKQQIIEKVKSGKLDGAVVYPADLIKNRTYTVYTSSNDLTQSSTLSEFGSNVLKSSLYAPLGSPEIIALAQQGASSNVVSFEDGQQTAGIMEYVVPGFFVVLFYIVLVFSVNYMLTSVAEEKENRSMEMVLSYVKPRTLILGKLLGISLVTLTQIIFLFTVAVLAYFTLKYLNSPIALPLDIDLSQLVFDPAAIALALGYLLFGFLLFASLMAGVGSMVPSAKDAGSLSFVFIIGAIIPFYTIGMITTDPENPITQVMTFFPTTAPTTLLLRNAVGNLSTLEAIAGLLALIVWSILAIMLAGKLFKLGALEYNNRLSLKSLFR